MILVYYFLERTLIQNIPSLSWHLHAKSVSFKMSLVLRVRTLDKTFLLVLLRKVFSENRSSKWTTLNILAFTTNNSMNVHVCSLWECMCVRGPTLNILAFTTNSSMNVHVCSLWEYMCVLYESTCVFSMRVHVCSRAYLEYPSLHHEQLYESTSVFESLPWIS